MNGIYLDAWDRYQTNIEVYDNLVVRCGNGIIVGAENNGHLDGVPVSGVQEFESQLFDLLDRQHPEYARRFEEKRVMDDELKALLQGVLNKLTKAGGPGAWALAETCWGADHSPSSRKEYRTRHRAAEPPPREWSYTRKRRLLCQATTPSSGRGHNPRTRGGLVRRCRE